VRFENWEQSCHERARVVELKTVEVIPSSPWRDHAVQVQVYGLLLDLVGFDCSSLKLSVWYARRGWKLLPLLCLTSHSFSSSFLFTDLSARNPSE
jgi:hypothetical protein